MRAILALSLATMGLLAACGDEPEVAEVEAPMAVDPVVTDTELVTADPATGWDVNNDRNFDRAEYTGFRDREFVGWDTDRDQNLSRTEFDAGWTRYGWRDPGTAFTAFDDNNDTMLSNDEFFGDDEFSEWDTNTSGILETNEWGFGA